MPNTFDLISKCSLSIFCHKMLHIKETIFGQNALYPMIKKGILTFPLTCNTTQLILSQEFNFQTETCGVILPKLKKSLIVSHQLFYYFGISVIARRLSVALTVWKHHSEGRDFRTVWMISPDWIEEGPLLYVTQLQGNVFRVLEHW